MESVGLKSRKWAAQRGTKKTLGRLAAQSLIVMIHFPIPSALHSRALGQSGLQQPAAGADGNQLALLKPAAGRPKLFINLSVTGADQARMMA